MVGLVPTKKYWSKLQCFLLVIYNVTTLYKYSSTNLFIGNKLPDENLKSLGYSNFARHYSRNRCLLSLPRPTKMFQFRRLPLPTLCIQVRVTRHNSSRVSPFGNPRFKAGGQLPEAYRSLLRPLSVKCVKAFVVCAYVTFYVYISPEGLI